MKKLIYIIICVMTAWSCKEISESERFEYVKPAEVNRNVLLEDYTGQRCINCPNAADEIHKLQELYGEDHVIAVAIHGGPMAVRPTSKVVGLRNDLADTYYNAANIEVNPMGVINRSGVAIVPDQWQSAVSEAIQKTAPVDIVGKATLGDGKVKVEIDVNAVDGNTTGKLQLWLIESGIVAIQLMPDGSTNANYVHNHVLRAAINGEWGEDIRLTEGNSVQSTHEISLEDAWIPEHLSVIAFVYNDSGVLQVISLPVIISYQLFAENNR